MLRGDLYAKLVSTIDAPRSLIVEYLIQASIDIGRMSAQKLTARSGESQFREAQTQGEIIAAEIFHALLPQNIVDEDTELQDLCNIAQELTDQTDNAVLWAEFVDKVHKLK